MHIKVTPKPQTMHEKRTVRRQLHSLYALVTSNEEAKHHKSKHAALVDRRPAGEIFL